MRVRTVAIAVLAGACSADGPEAPSFAVSDSAGVEVVTTSTPSWGDGASPWQLTLETEIGEVEGEEVYLFGDPVSALRLADGRVVVADAQSADLRFYGPDGTFVSRSGSRGEGPGEFQSFSWLARCGERLLAHDWQLRRATPIDVSGEVGDPFIVGTPEARPPYRLRCLPDGSFLAVGWGEQPPIPDGEDYLYFAQTADLWRFFADSDSVITVGTYISSERLAHIDRATGGGGNGPHPFGRSVVFAGSGTHIFIGGAERLQIEVRTLEGGLIRILRGPDSELLIDERWLSVYGEAPLSRADSALREWLADADYPMPERYPAYSELLVDALGFVWVERFVVPWEEERRWGIFSPEGSFLGHVNVPARLQVTDVSEEHVVGIVRDELDVPRIQVYRLQRTD